VPPRELRAPVADKSIAFPPLDCEFGGLEWSARWREGFTGYPRWSAANPATSGRIDCNPLVMEDPQVNVGLDLELVGKERG
jgi:hypothetical protein